MSREILVKHGKGLIPVNLLKKNFLGADIYVSHMGNALFFVKDENIVSIMGIKSETNGAIISDINDDPIGYSLVVRQTTK